MEEKGIIRKSTSEYASPLVMVWKKDGGLRICNDFRWLNVRTIKDAHPLPHQSDCLAALGGNCFFSTMDPGPQEQCILPQSTSAQRPSLVLQLFKLAVDGGPSFHVAQK